MPKIKIIEMLKINDGDPTIKSDPEFDKKCKQASLISGRKHRAKISLEKAQSNRFFITFDIKDAHLVRECIFPTRK